MPNAEPITTQRRQQDALGEIFRAFLKLGLTSFGGPIAHLGYFREEFVRRRGWLDEAHFAQLLAVCQFLPGPASSQMGFAIGLFRGGWAGALTAFLAFTLPSALLMFGFAVLAPHLGVGAGAAAVHGLKLVAVVVVAHGVLGMIRALAPDAVRALITVGAVTLVVLTQSAWMQLGAIALGGLAGRWLCRGVTAPAMAVFPVAYGRRRAAVFLCLFLVGLAAAIALPPGADPSVSRLAGAFYRAGALVFGGGHVVLPLLQQSIVEPGWITQDAFLAGYGAAQAVPGPMFSLSAYLGAEVPLECRPPSAPWSPCWRSFFPVSCCCWPWCRFGADWRNALGPPARWRASMPPWSGFWSPPSTIQSGRKACAARSTSPSPPSASPCLRRPESRPSGSLHGASRHRLSRTSPASSSHFRISVNGLAALRFE